MTAAGLASGDERFTWDAHFGGAFDFVDYVHGRMYFLADYQAVLGSEFRSRARPVRFESGELWVEVESAVHLHELRNFAGEAYRRSANERLASRGASAIIERIVFKLGR